MFRSRRFGRRLISTDPMAIPLTGLNRDRLHTMPPQPVDRHICKSIPLGGLVNREVSYYISEEARPVQSANRLALTITQVLSQVKMQSLSHDIGEKRHFI